MLYSSSPPASISPGFSITSNPSASSKSLKSSNQFSYCLSLAQSPMGLSLISKFKYSSSKLDNVSSIFLAIFGLKGGLTFFFLYK